MSSAFGESTCYIDNAMVKLTGTIQVMNVPSDPDTGHPAYHYPLLKLDHPLCYKDAQMGNIPSAKVVALVGPTAHGLDHFKSGQHVTVTGNLMHTDNGNQPPQDLMLMVGG